MRYSKDMNNEKHERKLTERLPNQASYTTGATSFNASKLVCSPNSNPQLERNGYNELATLSR